jgi:hypothetical protein
MRPSDFKSLTACGLASVQQHQAESSFTLRTHPEWFFNRITQTSPALAIPAGTVHESGGAL